MPILKNVVGLDLGSHTIRAAELRQTLRGIEAVQLRELPRDQGEDLSLPELLRRFASLHRLPSEHVVCALPGDRLSVRRLSFPFSERRRLAQAVPFEIEDDLPFDIDDFLVDWELAGGDRNRSEVVAALAPRARVSELLETLGEAGFPPRTLEAEGLVLGNLAAVFDLPDTRLLLDLGHERTTFCVLVNGRPALARTCRMAGAALTRALSLDRGLDPGDAERAKCEDGVFDAAGGSGQETRTVLDQLARETARVLGAAEPVVNDLGAPPVSELTLFGGTAQLAGLDEYLTARLGLPAARLGLPREEQAAGLAAAGSPVTFASAIALALRGTAEARTRINFRQDEFAVRVDLGRIRRDFRWTGYLAAAAAGLAILSFGTATALESRRVAELERRIAEIYRGAFPNRPTPENVVPAMREAVREANERAEFLGVYAGNLSALDLLTEVSRAVPPDLDIVIEELTIDRQLVRMRVYATRFEAADRLRAELAEFPAFSSVRIGAIETDRQTGGKRFNVTIGLGAREERA